MSPDDLWALPRVGAPAPAPDGSRFVVPVSTWDAKEDLKTCRLWLVPADAKGAGSGRRGDPARPLTTADASSADPAVSPDGTRLAFLRKPGPDVKGAKHGDAAQLYVMPLDGGEPERLTDLPLGVAAPVWFPDGRRIAFLGTVYRDALDLESAAARKADLQADGVKVKVTEERFYRYWDRWLTDGEVQHVFVLDTESGALLDLTPGSGRIVILDAGEGRLAVSPDGREVAFGAIRGSPPREPLTDGIYLVRVPARAGGKPPKIRELAPRHPADVVRPVYSPDGRFLVYGLRREIDFYADRVRIAVHERKTGRQTVLTEDWDRSAMGWSFGDDPGRLHLAAEAEGRVALFTLDLDAALADPAANPPVEFARGGTLTGPRPAGGRVFVNRSTLREPPEIWSYDPATGEGRSHTAFTAPLLKGLLLSAVRDIRFPGAGGVPVQAFLLYPPGARARAKGGKGRKPPLVHMIHGGPHGIFADQWHWRWNAQAFAAPGHLVACVNFHGSTSFGQDFAASILGRWGDQPYRDVMAATDHLVEAGLVDPKRMAATGGSYGGYLVSWIAAQTDRFRCVVNHAGVADFQSQYASDITQGRARSMGGEPWDRQDGLDRYNPMRHAKGFRTPMLVLHGEKDYRVPYGLGLEVYNVYKAMGRPARLVVYPKENHWILDPKASLHWYGEVLSWLKRWLVRNVG